MLHQYTLAASSRRILPNHGFSEDKIQTRWPWQDWQLWDRQTLVLPELVWTVIYCRCADWWPSFTHSSPLFSSTQCTCFACWQKVSVLCWQSSWILTSLGGAIRWKLRAVAPWHVFQRSSSSRSFLLFHNLLVSFTSADSYTVQLAVCVGILTGPDLHIPQFLPSHPTEQQSCRPGLLKSAKVSPSIMTVIS